MVGWGTSYRRAVCGTAASDLESSMTLPLCVQWEPEMGRVASVKLQWRTAEVWLLTSEGSVRIVGPFDEQKGK